MQIPSGGSAPNSRSAWRQCLWLCLPALLIGAALRISVLMTLPEAYYGSDSNSYFQTTSMLWTEGKLELKSKRRWIYPLVLVPTPLLPGRTVQIIAVAQHALGLVTLIGIGWIVLHLTHRPKVWVPLVTTLAAVWPRTLWYEHEVIAEALFLATIVLAVALAFPVGCLRRPQRLFYYLLAVTLIVAVKPHGKPIWMGLMLAAVLLAGVPWRWATKNILAAVASVVVMLSAGSSSQGAWLLLSSALPLVRTEGEKWSEYRQVLRPLIEEARADLSQYPWNQYQYKKMLADSRKQPRLGPVWTKLREDQGEFSRVARGLAMEGILHAPLTYAHLVLIKTGMVLSDETAGDRLVPREFWKRQEANNDERWERRPKEMELLYEMDRADYQALVAERRPRHAWYAPYLPKFTHVFAWTRTVWGKKNTLHAAWFGVLALFGLLTCLRPSRFKPASPLWLSLLLYMGLIFSVGDTVSRYLQPVEWIGLISVALGLDWLLQLVLPGRGRAAATAAETLPAVAQTAP